MLCFYFLLEENSEDRGFEEFAGISKFMDKFNHDILENNIKVINLDVTAKEYHEYKKPIFCFYLLDKRSGVLHLSNKPITNITIPALETTIFYCFSPLFYIFFFFVFKKFTS